ncbi:exodeoxyribonuclease V subunit beta [Methylonatrum kenyense]|uniref:exodeoxyribonuclease V subunit beta n=1 Tax=Methylonatrum kenyense TaxID=455253 RepID=UPI0020C1378A|nr:exodeoxyribonuclease V subunit beta [Methylonatrum kenyense]MCK8514968.1 exodeoxyribonuclease V subunit beta [Methylonatrum kenyense]
MSSPRTLDPLAVPLADRHLIEASAGTGKTYTLAALYLRLVLGHDPADPERAPMLPPDILVVTFTEAATKELRDRIRGRLAEAARCFAGHAEPDPNDAILPGLLAAYPEGEARQRHADHLRAAADWMDEAAIYTIHGFCHRMLRQHAFDSGNAFELELSDEEALIQRQAIEDYWRQHLYPLGPPELAALGITIAASEDKPKLSLDQFAKTVGGLLGKSERFRAIPDEPPTEALRRAAQPWHDAIRDLRQAVETGLDSFNDALEAGWKNEVLGKGSKPTAGTWRGKLLPGLQDWRKRGASLLPDTNGAALADLGSACLEKAVRKNQVLPDTLANHPLPAAVDRLLDSAQHLSAASAPLYAHAARWIDQRIERSKQQRGLIGFQDMLTRLHDALRQPGGGPRLARVIGEQFPVALIDEFQDTDPVQYGIFRAVYVEPENTKNSLFLIGDPKQAIYGFRGADLDTYLGAAEKVPAEQRHTLGRNFRSSQTMVEAVNSLFGNSPTAPDQFLQPDIRFHPVAHKGRREQLEIDGAAPPAMTLWHREQQTLDESVESLPLKDYRRHMAEIGAEHIARLLHNDKAGFRRPDGWQPLRPADIAILVRTGQEAGLIRDALRARGLRSVYLSDRDNVLQTPEARDLLRWLQAIAEPESERRVRTALGTAALGYDWATLDALFGNDARWESALEQFQRYAELWQQRGILPALRQLIRDHQLAPRLLRQAGGERRLSNILQLAELLQDAAAALDGPAALIRWLDEELHREDGGSPADERILRLESDAALIKVVTIHKAKGLEYPLVFLPFICSFRPAKAETPLTRPDGDGLSVSFEVVDADKELAEDARQAEDMRLLYVAVTRAIHACWLGMASVLQQRTKVMTDKSHLNLTAIGRLIGCEEKMVPDALGPLLKTVAGQHSAITVEPVSPPPAPAAPTALPDSGIELARARRYTATPPNRERWWIASYSALLEDGPKAWAPGSADEDVLVEESLEPAPSRGEPDPDSLHAFPRGPAAGTLLHNLLEALAVQQFPKADEPAFRRILQRGLRGRRWQDWLPQAGDWLGRIIDTPLPLAADAAPRLSALPRGAFIAELEFLLSVAEVRASQIDAVIRRHTLDGAGRPSLGENELHGMLKGFIDLVLEHEGRYFVIDYKSNDLGPTDAHYHPGALREAVMDKRYDAQYSLYLLALHRLLRARLGAAYDYDRHVGGAACLFLRGIGHTGRGVHAERPDRALVEELDALFSGEVTDAA